MAKTVNLDAVYMILIPMLEERATKAREYANRVVRQNALLSGVGLT